MKDEIPLLFTNSTEAEAISPPGSDPSANLGKQPPKCPEGSDPFALSDPVQAVSFGTSGHRGFATAGSFNRDHLLAITQAVVAYCRREGIDGPLFLGQDSHALSAPAWETAPRRPGGYPGHRLDRGRGQPPASGGDGGDSLRNAGRGPGPRRAP